MKPSEAIGEVRGMDVFSSVVLGPGASGRSGLFVAALGQAIPRLGAVPDDLFATHTPLTTNIWEASQLGYIGDAAVRGLRLDFICAALEDIQRVIEKGSYSLRVAGREQAAGGLRDLPKRYGIPIMIARNDTLRMTIEFTAPLQIEKPLLLRAVLSGVARSDVR